MGIRVHHNSTTLVRAPRLVRRRGEIARVILHVATSDNTRVRVVVTGPFEIDIAAALEIGDMVDVVGERRRPWLGRAYVAVAQNSGSLWFIDRAQMRAEMDEYCESAFLGE